MTPPSLSGNSYTIRSGYIPEVFMKLDKLLIFHVDGKILVREPQLAEHIDNMTIKLGFILLSKDYIVQCPSNDQTRMNYFVNHFVYDTKAFLDATSMLLNYFYSLNFEKGDIDLKWKRFRNALFDECNDIGKIVNSQERWISDVIEWREQLIHRISTPVIYFGTGEEMEANKLRIKMPVIPISMTELQKRAEELKAKYGSVEQEIIPFCDSWINEVKKLFEAVCSSIVEIGVFYTPKNPKPNVPNGNTEKDVP